MLFSSKKALLLNFLFFINFLFIFHCIHYLGIFLGKHCDAPARWQDGSWSQKAPDLW
jgi:hypothetical protein